MVFLNHIKKIFLNNNLILILILLNTITIFSNGFDLSVSITNTLLLIDNIITGFFILEIIIKLIEFGVKGYFKSSWNRFDFILIMISIPTLIGFISGIEISNISFLLVFRVVRVFKLFRFFKFITGIEDIIIGINKALKASIIILIGFIVYMFIIGVFSFYLFGAISLEYFGDPLISLYSVFKIFTIEGWYEIPEQLTLTLSPILSFFTYVYFIFIVITGGIFGVSLVNSIFVDAMVSDNNDELENKIDRLESKIDKLLQK